MPALSRLQALQSNRSITSFHPGKTVAEPGVLRRLAGGPVAALVNVSVVFIDFIVVIIIKVVSLTVLVVVVVVVVVASASSCSLASASAASVSLEAPSQLRSCLKASSWTALAVSFSSSSRLLAFACATV
jgi:hypothetical protein